jgi:hypothetical protein
MTTKITMQDLINSLRKAAAKPREHSEAQQHYFSEIQENSVLVNCGSACCVAGDLVLQAHADSSEEEIRTIIKGETVFSPRDWVATELRLTQTEAHLAFSCYTHHKIHSALADILEAGLRLPDVDHIGLSSDSYYDSFDCAYLEYEDKYISLGEVLDWMRSIAK